MEAILSTKTPSEGNEGKGRRGNGKEKDEAGEKVIKRKEY